MKSVWTRWIASYRKASNNLCVTKTDFDLNNSIVPDDVSKHMASDTAKPVSQLLQSIVQSVNVYVSCSDYMTVRVYLVTKLVLNEC